MSCVLCRGEPVAVVTVDGDTADVCADHVPALIEDDGAEIIDTYDAWNSPADRRAVYDALSAREGQSHE